MGWTDLELEETKEGDLQALEKTLEDVRGQSSREGRINRAGVGNIGSDLNGVACCEGSYWLWPRLTVELVIGMRGSIIQGLGVSARCDGGPQ